MYNVFLFVTMETESEKELRKQQEITLMQLKQVIKKKISELQVFSLYLV